MIKLTHEEIDTICLALSDAQEFRRKVNDNTNIVKVYESIRRKFRMSEPLPYGIKKLLLKKGNK